MILSVIAWPFGAEQEDGKIKKTSLDVPKAQELQDYEVIRISVGAGLKEITVSTDSPFRVLDGKNRPLFSGLKIAGAKLKPTESGIQMGPENFKETPLTIDSGEGSIRVGGKTYRRSLKIWREANGLLVINEVSIEDYLKGVLPAEASPSWPMESLKAQAIASRTYALFKAIENKDKKFVLSKDVLSQVYGGKSMESAATSRAVDETRGQVMTYQGKLFPAYFHSTCGGKTTRADYVWSVEPHSSLKGVECQFCWSSKHYRWSASFTRAEIEKRLKLKGVRISGIRDIQIAKIDQSGRARSFLIVHDKGKTEVPSNDFRIWVDPMKFKSTLVTTLDRTRDGFTFGGKGWGHGVGLCQYGMRQLAQLGYSNEQILEYYYPGSKVVRLWGEAPGIKSRLTQLKDKLEELEV